MSSCRRVLQDLVIAGYGRRGWVKDPGARRQLRSAQLVEHRTRSRRRRSPAGPAHPPAVGNAPRGRVDPSSAPSSPSGAGRPPVPRPNRPGPALRRCARRPTPLFCSSRRRARRDRPSPTLPRLDPISGELGVVDQTQFGESVQHDRRGFIGHPLGRQSRQLLPGPRLSRELAEHDLTSHCFRVRLWISVPLVAIAAEAVRDPWNESMLTRTRPRRSRDRPQPARRAVARCPAAP